MGEAFEHKPVAGEEGEGRLGECPILADGGGPSFECGGGEPCQHWASLGSIPWTAALQNSDAGIAQTTSRLHPLTLDR